jgi:hypothetical protein
MPKTSRPRREVIYVHHTKDQDGDVVLRFRDLTAGDPSALFVSSPIVGVKRLYAAVFDAAGRGDLASVLVSTTRTDYATTMPVRLFEHLQTELSLA